MFKGSLHALSLEGPEYIGHFQDPSEYLWLLGKAIMRSCPRIRVYGTVNGSEYSGEMSFKDALNITAL